MLNELPRLVSSSSDSKGTDTHDPSSVVPASAVKQISESIKIEKYINTAKSKNSCPVRSRARVYGQSAANAETMDPFLPIGLDAVPYAVYLSPPPYPIPDVSYDGPHEGMAGVSLCTVRHRTTPQIGSYGFVDGRSVARASALTMLRVIRQLSGYVLLNPGLFIRVVICDGNRVSCLLRYTHLRLLYISHWGERGKRRFRSRYSVIYFFSAISQKLS